MAEKQEKSPDKDCFTPHLIQITALDRPLHPSEVESSPSDGDCGASQILFAVSYDKSMSFGQGQSPHFRSPFKVEEGVVPAGTVSLFQFMNEEGEDDQSNLRIVQKYPKHHPTPEKQQQRASEVSPQGSQSRSSKLTIPMNHMIGKNSNTIVEPLPSHKLMGPSPIKMEQQSLNKQHQRQVTKLQRHMTSKVCAPFSQATLLQKNVDTERGVGLRKKIATAKSSQNVLQKVTRNQHGGSSARLGLCKMFSKTTAKSKVNLISTRRGSGSPIPNSNLTPYLTDEDEEPFDMARIIENNEYERQESEQPMHFSSHLKQFFERKSLETAKSGHKQFNYSSQEKTKLANKQSKAEKLVYGQLGPSDQNSKTDNIYDKPNRGRNRSSRLSLHRSESLKNSGALSQAKNAHSFTTQDYILAKPDMNQSPSHRFGNFQMGISLNTNKLHEKMIWFYRTLCEEYDCPVLPQFFQETIPSAFRSRRLTPMRKKSRGSEVSLMHSPLCSRESQLERSPGFVAKQSSGVVQLNTSMLSDKTVQAVCDTLRRFQQKIKVLQIYHNQEFKGAASQGSPTGKMGTVRINSPSKTFANSALPWSFPKPAHLFALLKNLTKTSSVRIICDVDCSQFITESHYQAFVHVLGRTPQPVPEADDQAADPTEGKKRASKALLSNIDIQGFHMKPSFFKHLITTIQAKKMSNLVSLALINCAIQDTEGQELCKVAILGRSTPVLRTLNLQKNLLGFKFGAGLITLLIDAQGIAQEETMKAVSKTASASGTANQLIKFESLDYFAIEKIDLQYNKISFLVIQTVEKLIKNLHQFKEQAKLHQNMFQMQSGRSQQQGSSLTAQITAQTLGNISTRGYQPNKVIIEQTEESIETTESSQEDSLDGKHLPVLFEEFIGKERQKANKRSISCNKSETGRRMRKACNTPDSYASYSAKRRNETLRSAELQPRWAGSHQRRHRNSQKRISDLICDKNETESVTSQILSQDIDSRSCSTNNKKAIQTVQGNTISLKVDFDSLAKDVDLMNFSPPQSQGQKVASVADRNLSELKADGHPDILAGVSSEEPIERIQRGRARLKVGALQDSDADFQQSICVQKFLDDCKAINRVRPPYQTQTAMAISGASPNRRVKQRTKLSNAGYRVPAKVDSGLATLVVSKSHRSISKIKSQLSPQRLDMNTPQKQAMSLAMKEKMEYTVTEIGNFMDPSLIKARTEVSFIKKPAQAPQIEPKKRIPRLVQKQAASKKKKGRSKVEGFFKTDVASNFGASAAKDVKQVRTSEPGMTSPLRSSRNPTFINDSKPQNEIPKSPQRSPAHQASFPIQSKAVHAKSIGYKTIRAGIVPYLHDSTRKSPRAAYYQSSNKELSNLMHGQLAKTAARGSSQKQQPQAVSGKAGNCSQKVTSKNSTENQAERYSDSGNFNLETEIEGPTATIDQTMNVSLENSEQEAIPIRQLRSKHNQPVAAIGAKVDPAMKLAPRKQLSLIKQASAIGENFVDETDDLAFDDMIEPSAQMDKQKKQPLFRAAVNDRSAGPSLITPCDVLTPPRIPDEAQIQYDRKSCLKRSRARMDLNSSCDDIQDQFFIQYDCLSAERNYQQKRGALTYNNSEAVFESMPQSKNTSPRNRYKNVPFEKGVTHHVYSALGGQKCFKNQSNSFVYATDKQTESRQKSSYEDRLKSTPELVVFDRKVSVPLNPRSRDMEENKSLFLHLSRSLLSLIDSNAYQLPPIQDDDAFQRHPVHLRESDASDGGDNNTDKLIADYINGPTLEDFETPAQESKPKQTQQCALLKQARQNDMMLVSQHFAVSPTFNSVQSMSDLEDENMLSDQPMKRETLINEFVSRDGNSDVTQKITRYSLDKYTPCNRQAGASDFPDPGNQNVQTTSMTVDQTSKIQISPIKASPSASKMTPKVLSRKASRKSTVSKTNVK